MANELTIGLPSKGRMYEDSVAFLERADLALRRDAGARAYRAGLSGLEGVSVVFLSAQDVVKELDAGRIHLGITGQDILVELTGGANAASLLPLGFGYADVVTAAPHSWIDVRTMRDLQEVTISFRERRGRPLRVATKYGNLTRDYFSRKAIFDYGVVESSGATEGAPAAGSAEIIVDITTTGRTLEANGLRILDDGVILSSQAHFFASSAAAWNSEALQAARRLLFQISAVERARTLREIRTSLPDGAIDAETLAEFGAYAPFKSWKEDKVILCPAESCARLAERLMREGAETALVHVPTHVFDAQETLYKKLLGKVDAGRTKD